MSRSRMGAKNGGYCRSIRFRPYVNTTTRHKSFESPTKVLLKKNVKSLVPIPIAVYLPPIFALLSGCFYLNKRSIVAILQRKVQKNSFLIRFLAIPDAFIPPRTSPDFNSF
jgi:hypothetical protein